MPMCHIQQPDDSRLLQLDGATRSYQYYSNDSISAISISREAFDTISRLVVRSPQFSSRVPYRTQPLQ